MAMIQQQKHTEEGLPLFLLPQAPLEVTVDVPKTVKTTDATDSPVMVTEQVPHLNADGEQVEYEVTRSEEQEDGSITQVGTGQWLKCWDTIEVQAQDDEGHLLFWTTVTEQETRLEPQPDLEITAEDEQYTEDLKPALEWVDVPEEPAPPAVPTPEQLRLNALEDAQKDLKRSIQLNEEKVDATTGNLGDFMDFYFSQTP
jgi:hypothetical protein